jgi:hypothetical protein
VHYSFVHNPADPPSVQIAQMASFNRGVEPLDLQALHNSLKMTLDEAGRLLDSEYCTKSLMRHLSFHLRCELRYLQAIHAAHAWDKHGVTPARAQKLEQAREKEAKKTNANHRGASTEKRAKDGGIGFGLPDELL